MKILTPGQHEYEYLFREIWASHENGLALQWPASTAAQSATLGVAIASFAVADADQPAELEVPRVGQRGCDSLVL